MQPTFVAGCIVAYEGRKSALRSFFATLWFADRCRRTNSFQFRAQAPIFGSQFRWRLGAFPFFSHDVTTPGNVKQSELNFFNFCKNDWLNCLIEVKSEDRCGFTE